MNICRMRIQYLQCEIKSIILKITKTLFPALIPNVQNYLFLFTDICTEQFSKIAIDTSATMQNNSS